MEKHQKTKQKKEIVRLTGRELQMILRQWGYSQAEFSRFMGRHKNYFTRKFLDKPGPIPLRYITELQDFMGEEDFNLAMEMIKDLREKRNG